MIADAVSRSWGRLAYAPAKFQIEEDWRFSRLPTGPLVEEHSLLPIGNNRSYGDSAINENQVTLSTRRLNRLLTFDRERGLLHCESGLLFAEILRIILPHGWYLPVVPGTQLVTLGGAIANDIHGKNHVTVGSLGCHIEELTLLRSDGQRLTCSAHANTALFRATIGGLGLTGLIIAAKMRLAPVPGGMLEVEVLPFSSLCEYLQITRESSSWPYTVAWVDCAQIKHVGRGLFTRGQFTARQAVNRAKRTGTAPGIPVKLPVSLVNGASVRLFNKLYYALGKRKSKQLVWHEQFFFPLDAIKNWNRIYGPRGFYQFQFVVPFAAAEEVVTQVMREVATAGGGSFLAVLKDFGKIESPGILSFPLEGLTLAVDLPNRGPATLTLLDNLDHLVVDAGGRLYPAKDARMSGTIYRQQYPRWTEFETLRDPKFSSSFWRRVTQ